MGYNNTLGRSVSRAVTNLNQRAINHENNIDEEDDHHKNDVTSQLEFVVDQNPDVYGGQGHNVNTMFDLGFEPVNSANGKPIVRKRKVKGGGASGGALQSAVSAEYMHGDPPETTQSKVTVKARKFDYEGSGMSAGGMSAGGASAGGMSAGGASAGSIIGGKQASLSKRNAIVKKIMLEHKISLPEASKYVKTHGLYKK